MCHDVSIKSRRKIQRRISLWMLRFRRSWAFSSSRDWFLAEIREDVATNRLWRVRIWTQINWFFEVSDMLIAFLFFHILVYSTWMYRTHHLRLNSRYSCTSIFVDIPIVWIAPFQSLAQFWARPQPEKVDSPPTNRGGYSCLVLPPKKYRHPV